MKEKATQAWQKMRETFGAMSKKVRILLGVMLVLIIAGIVAGVVVMNSGKPYAVLFTELTSEDMQSVLGYLDETGATNYQVKNNDTILVPAEQEAALKAKVLMQGYPTSGFGYTLYLDNVNALSTESDRKNLQLLDLQERLGAVARSFDGVKDAQVTIAQGEDRRYVLDSDNVLEASASVILTMQNGKTLSREQTDAIRGAVARSVKGLEISNIDISDTTGKRYTSGDESMSSDASQLKLAMEEQINNKVRNGVMEVLTPLFGLSNVSVTVNSTVDVSRSTQEQTEYSEPAWAADGSTGGKGIIGSRVYEYNIGRDTDATVGGPAGTTTNADLNTYVEEGYQPDGQETNLYASGQTDYNVDTKNTKTERAAGVVTDVMVSVSINSETAGNTGTDSLRRHVARAAGIIPELETEKISILAVPFYNPDTAPAGTDDGALSIQPWMLYALIAGVILFVILLMIILIVRGRSKKRKARLAAQEAAQQQQMLYAMAGMAPPEGDGQGADIMDLRTERSMELRKDVRAFAENNPEIAAQMVRGWLRGGEDANG